MCEESRSKTKGESTTVIEYDPRRDPVTKPEAPAGPTISLALETYDRARALQDQISLAVQEATRASDITADPKRSCGFIDHQSPDSDPFD
jgi:hypothetical protein